MALLKFPIIKFTLCLCIGIILAHYFRSNPSYVWLTTISLILITSLYWLIGRNHIIRSPFFAILTYASLISLGLNTYNIHNEKLHPYHYTNATSTTAATHSIVLQIQERLKPDRFNYKYVATIVAIDQHAVSGKLLINIRRDSSFKNLPVNTIFWTRTELKPIPEPLNPYQFDYKQFLELKYIYHQLHLNTEEIFVRSVKPTNLHGFADQIRSLINVKLIEAGLNDEVLSITNALLLGQKQHLDRDIYTSYVNAGTIHILAVSGLHVGILTLILNFLGRPLLAVKYGHLIKPVVIVILLWCFAIIAGLSPSVTRAVTMFSIVTIGWHLKRPSNIYNTLAISAFFILLFNPMVLFEVGFQMSYLAVIGIVSFQPFIYKTWIPKTIISEKLWQIFTVTLAAQIGVAPISLFYFHQFPGLFFISNVVVIPFLGLILGLGLLIIVLALLNLLHACLVATFSFVIERLNQFMAWIAQFEEFLFRDIPFTLAQVLCSYFVIFTLWQSLKTHKPKWILFCLIGIIAFQSTFISNKFGNSNDAFVVFNKSRHTLLGHKQGDHLMVFHNLDSTELAMDPIISNYQMGEHISKINSNPLQHVYQFKSETILVIDSLGTYHGLNFNPDYVLLRSSPKINLNRLLDSIYPKTIIADASNFKTYVKRWKRTCIQKKVPFHYTNEKGAFILN